MPILVASLSCRETADDLARKATPTRELPRSAFECSQDADEAARARYGELAVLNPNTNEFDDFYKTVYEFALDYGIDISELDGRDFENDYERLMSKSPYVSPQAEEAWDFMTRNYEACLTSISDEDVVEPTAQYGSRTSCVAAAVAATWQTFGKDSLAYSDEFGFTLDAVKQARDPPEVSIDEAHALATDYAERTDKSPYTSAEAVAYLHAHVEHV